MPDPGDRIPAEEMQAALQRLDEPTRLLLEERWDKHFHRDILAFLTPPEAELVRAMARRLIPQEPLPVDLVSFFDWAATQPLGIGARPAGQPDLAETFRLGFVGVHETAQAMYGGRDYLHLSAAEQDGVLRAIQEGRPPGETWQRVHSRHFFIQFYRRLLAGWLADPSTWSEIGFPGPAYPEGYLWGTCDEVRGRRQRRAS